MPNKNFKNRFEILKKTCILAFVLIAVKCLLSELLAYNHWKSFFNPFLGHLLYNPSHCGLKKTAVRVFLHLQIIKKKRAHSRVLDKKQAKKA